MRALLLLLTAGLTGGLAAAGFAFAGMADVFAPCRVAYRVSDELYGSLACQLYYTLGLFSAVLAFAACGLLAVAGILFILRRRAPE
jgi:cytosine/adenosine deaminase-related metal-dependent hydrolase